MSLAKRYVRFLEKKNKVGGEKIFYGFLKFLSVLYGWAVGTRNWLYDSGVLTSWQPPKKVISIGNISWAGSGKTTLALFLYEKLSGQFKTALLRRGYGRDEGRLLQEKIQAVLSSPDRVKMIKAYQKEFDLFILDDGFQYRKIKPHLNIVVMAARELRTNFQLIPASYFREPLSSLRRADVLIISYKNEIHDPVSVKEDIARKFPHLKIYFSSYTIKQFVDMRGHDVPHTALEGQKIAAFAAIGYPQGFFNLLHQSGISLAEKIVYPDHHELSRQEFHALEKNLLSRGIYTLIITRKDKYHLPREDSKVNVCIADIDLHLDFEGEFLNEIKTNVLSGKNT